MAWMNPHIHYANFIREYRDIPFLCRLPRMRIVTDGSKSVPIENLKYSCTTYSDVGFNKIQEAARVRNSRGRFRCSPDFTKGPPFFKNAPRWARSFLKNAPIRSPNITNTIYSI